MQEDVDVVSQVTVLVQLCLKFDVIVKCSSHFGIPVLRGHKLYWVTDWMQTTRKMVANIGSSEAGTSQNRWCWDRKAKMLASFETIGGVQRP